ncbi:MAG: hypothetical protein BMS9Abin19_0016 [Gammaproteobacteria bacterium]|nr:MAG: hypothetical protein BMS9Abin19_0016 [Gammaproteobacteria bacterium]
MAAELSTAAPIMLALKGADADVALIIVNMKVNFVKKARSRITFTCMDYEIVSDTIAQLKQAEDTTAVTAKTIGRDVDGGHLLFYLVI